MTTTQKQTAGVAVASLILGLLGFVPLNLLCTIPAVICGHIGLSSIKKNPEALQGRGMALAGLIMGYIQIAILLVALPLMAIAIPSIAKATERAQEVTCISNMQNIETAKDTIALNEGLSKYTEVNEQAVNQMMGTGMGPSCPNDGVYQYNPIGVPPVCSVHGSLDPDESE